MQVRYQAALRPDESEHYSVLARTEPALLTQQRQNPFEFAANMSRVEACCKRRGQRNGYDGLHWLRFFQAIARTVDGEAMFVKQFADAADQQHLMVPVSYTHLTLPTIYSV